MREKLSRLIEIDGQVYKASRFMWWWVLRTPHKEYQARTLKKLIKKIENELDKHKR